MEKQVHQDRNNKKKTKQAPDIQTTRANFSENDMNCFRELLPSLTSQLQLRNRGKIALHPRPQEDRKRKPERKAGFYSLR